MRHLINSRLRKHWDNLYSNGIFAVTSYYWLRIKMMLFAKSNFGRLDIHIFPNARLAGTECMHIGKKFSAGKGLWLEAVKEYSLSGQKFSPVLVIGDGVSLGEYVHIGCNHRVVIGDDVLMGSKIYITDHNHGVYTGDAQDCPSIPPIFRRLTEGKSVEIGDKCWIGEFVTILPGVSIGEGCIIGSHSTVTHDIPANSIAVGSPAKIIKKWDADRKSWINYTYNDVVE